MACARSLHFQFLLWYFHTLPLLLLLHTHVPGAAAAAYVLALELCWGNHPPQAWSAAGITLLHALLLLALWRGRPTPARLSADAEEVADSVLLHKAADPTLPWYRRVLPFLRRAAAAPRISAAPAHSD